MPDVADDVLQHRAWLLSRVSLAEPGTVLDLGCGAGADLLALAARGTHPGQRFVGLDSSDETIRSAIGASKDSRVAFRTEQLGRRLPFEDNDIDVVYSHNLVECLSDRPGFVREVARVLKPGGQVVVAHWDFDSQVYDGSDKARVRRLIHAFADWQQNWMEDADGWMGRRLWGLFASSGLFEGSVQARTLSNTVYAPPWYGYARVQDMRALVARGLVSAGDYAGFLEDQETLSQQGRYFYSITGYAYVGRCRAV